ncbi:hypothetical protein JCGZ_26552 [Jatropha curcas]|uniref:Uncharacterized protein n=1 Tax=Jatropha curcas TaxID=180498 RepID=A0A067JP17_JATCU|nr:hypothetical protein JCGZ_26552 [Jatropha curcas]
MVSLDLSDEDFLESLGISLDEVNVMAGADTHASVTGIYAQVVPNKPPNCSTQKVAKGPAGLLRYFDTCTVEQAPSQPPITHSSRASGPSTRTLRRRPQTDPSSSTPVEGPSQAGPSRPSGPSRAPRAISKATGPLHLGLANLRLPYNISYYTPDGTLAFWKVSLENVDRLDLPPEDINEMMELMLGIQQELSSSWTLRAFDDQRRRRPRR